MLLLIDCSWTLWRPIRGRSISAAALFAFCMQFCVTSTPQAPLPNMYAFLAICFFAATGAWAFVLARNRDSCDVPQCDVLLRICRSRLYKVHYLMLVLVLVKSLSLAFRAVDYYFISVPLDELWC